MAKKDNVKHINTAPSIAPAVYDTDSTVDGASADMQNHNSATAVIHIGTWTDGTHTFEVQESSNNSTFTAVATADLTGAEPVISDGTTDDSVIEIGYHGNKRYLRVSVTIASATTGAVYSASIVRSHPRFAGASTFTANS